MIVFDGVTCSFEDQVVLREVSFQTSPQEIKVIFGGSGSGKTTILRLMLGLLQPNDGRIFVNGLEVTNRHRCDLLELRRRIGMVFQEGALFDSLTVGENVGYRLFEDGQLSEREIEDRVRQLLSFVEMEDAIDKMPDELSGGMRRRVAIMRALAAQDAKIMLYDEPTTGLDPINSRNICDLIRQVRDKRGVTSVMVTHKMGDAFMVGDRFMGICDGRIIFEGTADELRRSDHDIVKGFLI